MSILTRALDAADKRRDDGMCYWVEIFGDESGSCFDEFSEEEIFSFSSISEAVRKINELSPATDDVLHS